MEKVPCAGNASRVCECRPGMFCVTSAINSCARCEPHSTCAPGMVVQFRGKYPHPQPSSEIWAQLHLSPATAPDVQMTSDLPLPASCWTDLSLLSRSCRHTYCRGPFLVLCVPSSERPWWPEAQACLDEVLGWFEARGRSSLMPRKQEANLESLSWEFPRGLGPVSPTHY